MQTKYTEEYSNKKHARRPLNTKTSTLKSTRKLEDAKYAVEFYSSGKLLENYKTQSTLSSFTPVENCSKSTRRKVRCRVLLQWKTARELQDAKYAVEFYSSGKLLQQRTSLPQTALEDYSIVSILTTSNSWGWALYGTQEFAFSRVLGGGSELALATCSTPLPWGWLGRQRFVVAGPGRPWGALTQALHQGWLGRHRSGVAGPGYPWGAFAQALRQGWLGRHRSGVAGPGHPPKDTLGLHQTLKPARPNQGYLAVLTNGLANQVVSMRPPWVPTLGTARRVWWSRAAGP